MKWQSSGKAMAKRGLRPREAAAAQPGSNSARLGAKILNETANDGKAWPAGISVN